MKRISRITTSKTNTKNKSKTIKKPIFLNGKKEFKLPQRLISKHSPSLILMTENLKPTNFSSGLLSLFMANHKLNTTGPISKNKFLSGIKDRTLNKD